MRLAAQGLAIGFGTRVLRRDLDLELQPGECWALLGNNGTGKSTLLHVLAGLRPGLAGGVRLDGIEIGRLASSERARRIGLLLQEEPGAFWGTLLEYVLLGRYPHRRWLLGATARDEAIVREALARTGLAALAARTLSTLSGGERQRARLAQILAQDPDVYLLDEPLQHLDLRHRLEAMRLLRELAHAGGKSVLMVVHDPAYARRYCDRALLLFDDGAVRVGPAAQLLTRELLESLYGCPVEVDALSGGGEGRGEGSARGSHV